jgi:hypothetical protein
MRSLPGGYLPWRDRSIPRRFFEPAILRRRMPDIVSMAAHTAQIAMTDFVKRMCDSLPRVLQAPVRAILPSREIPTGTTVL